MVDRQRTQAEMVILSVRAEGVLLLKSLGQRARRAEDVPGRIHRRPALLDGCRRLRRHVTRTMPPSPVNAKQRAGNWRRSIMAA